jgi:hypothetical protein
MNVKDSKIVESDESQNIRQPMDKSRRSFAKKSAAIAPVIMTLANRSAWGGTNMCSQSGFQSFAAPGAVLSNVAHVKNTNWRNPNGTNGWSSTTSWPVGFGRATKIAPGGNIKFTSADWSGNKDLSYVQDLENGSGAKKYLVNPTFSTSADKNLTLLDALANTDILVYQIATALNNTISPVPSYFLTSTVTLSEFQTFYANCV